MASDPNRPPPPPNNPSSSSNSAPKSPSAPPNPETSHPSPSQPNTSETADWPPETSRPSPSHPNADHGSNYLEAPQPYPPPQYYCNPPPYPGPQPPYHQALPGPYYPPPPPVYPTFTEGKKDSGCIRCLGRIFLILLLVCIFMVAFLAFMSPMVWDIVPAFSLTNATVHSFKVNASSPSADLDLTFSVINYSKKYRISFARVYTSIDYAGRTVVGRTSQPQFEQDQGTQTVRRARVLISDGSKLGELVVERMKEEMKRNNGTVEFVAVFEADLRFGDSGSGNLDVYCPGLKVKFVNETVAMPGQLMMTSPLSCMID